MSGRKLTEYAKTLRCVECATETTDGVGWRALLTIDDEIAVYCPECAAREFDGPVVSKERKAPGES
jgi:hypothetical protein